MKMTNEKITNGKQMANDKIKKLELKLKLMEEALGKLFLVTEKIIQEIQTKDEIKLKPIELKNSYIG